jgi:hypothetical protein
MIYNHPITEIIPQRFSCRSYVETPIPAAKRERLQEAMAELQSGPLGSTVRFQLLASTLEESDALRGLGTYGLLKGVRGFLAGAVQAGPKSLEDYGYCLEELILLATDLELGTCWLGGLFTRSGFARRLALTRHEQLPAVSTIGVMADLEKERNTAFRARIGSHGRLPWERIFFQGRLGVPLAREQAGAYATVLDMVRVAPSASNKQPWRLVWDGNAYHFYVQRTPGYGGLAGKLVGIADLQRVDLGIAMCHFALTARELGLAGQWVVREPALDMPKRTEYIVSWVAG